MGSFVLTDEQAAAFEADGYLLVPSLLDAEENDLLLHIARADHRLEQESWSRHDRGGATTKISLRNDLSDDIYSAICRSRRVVDAMERVLGGEVYHYHHKMTMKEPFTGGAWEWHQDYGYWYNNGCLFPHMGSCYIAVDRATRENGCMQVLRGSHHMGRIEHGVVADQTGADLERVEKALERLELVYAEMEPGDGLFFHSNTLHRSDQNRSPNPRWGFISCYNAARNDPYKVIPGGHPNYTPLEKWDDSRVMETGRRQWEALRRVEVAAGTVR
jgi:ectoine hydroxylase